MNNIKEKIIQELEGKIERHRNSLLSCEDINSLNRTKGMCMAFDQAVQIVRDVFNRKGEEE